VRSSERLNALFCLLLKQVQKPVSDSRNASPGKCSQTRVVILTLLVPLALAIKPYPIYSLAMEKDVASGPSSNGRMWLMRGAAITFLGSCLVAWELLTPSATQEVMKQPSAGETVKPGVPRFMDVSQIVPNMFESWNEIIKESKHPPDAASPIKRKWEGAQESIRQGRVKEGLEAMESLGRDQNLANVLACVACAYAQLGNVSKAKELLELKSTLQTSDDTMLGIAYMMIGDTQNAIAALNRAIQSPDQKQNESARVDLATLYWSHGQYDLSRQLATESLKIFPKSARLHYALGQTYLKEALNERERGDANEKEIRSMLLKALSQYKDAMNFSNRSTLELVTTANNVGMAVDNLGLRPTALEYWNYAEMEAEKNHVVHAPLLFNLGKSAADQGDSVTSLAYFEKSINADGNYWEAYIAAGNLMVRSERFTEAVKYLQKANAINPGSAREQLLLCALLTGNFEEARRINRESHDQTQKDAINQSISEWEKSYDDRSPEGRKRFGELMLQVGAPRAAINALNAIGQKDDAQLALMKGEAYEALNDQTQASKEYETVVSLEPSSLVGNMGIARCLKKAHREKEALAQLKSLLLNAKYEDQWLGKNEELISVFDAALGLAVNSKDKISAQALIERYREISKKFDMATLTEQKAKEILEDAE
jgi:tetratricopeptide (TPR) repeat protein